MGFANEFSLAARISFAAGDNYQNFIKDVSRFFSPSLKLAEGGHVRAGILYNYAYTLNGKITNPDGTLDCLLQPESRREVRHDEIEEIQRNNYRILTAFNEYDLERSWRPHDTQQLEKRRKFIKGHEIWKAAEQVFLSEIKKRNNRIIFLGSFKSLLIQMAYET